MNALPLASAFLAISIAATLHAADPSITIYNQDFGVVRDTVSLDLKAGINEASFSGVTAQVEPDSVILRDPTGKIPLQILEQSYRNDPVSQELLLSLFEGKVIDFVRREPSKPNEIIKGKVVRSGYVPGGDHVQPIIEVDGKLQFDLPGMPQFPSLGDNTVLKPTLGWKLQSAQAVKLDAELAYVTNGFDWEASYNVVQPEKGNTIDVVGWVTLKNFSGTSFNNARIKLLAGDVNKIQPPLPGARVARMATMAGAPAEAVVTEKTFDEFHLYTLPNATTLRDKETKQVEFVRAAGVKSERIYVYDGAVLHGWRPGMTLGGDPGYEAAGNKKVAVYREFKNTKENNLGIPLPAGRIRFYTKDEADQSLQFVGENTIEHTPKDELLRLYVGDSFDLVGERKRTDMKRQSANQVAEESFEIKLRNRKTEPVTIRVVEHLYRWTSWEIIQKSHDFEKKDAQTIEFRITVQPDQEATVNYRVRYNW